MNREEAQSVIKSYGWNAEGLVIECRRAAKTLVVESEESTFSLNPDFLGGERASLFPIFLESDRRTESELLSDFFDRSAGEEEAGELIEEHAEKMTEAINVLLEAELETCFPGIDWYLSVCYGDGIFGVCVEAEIK